jgi:hypothetical protein
MGASRQRQDRRDRAAGKRRACAAGDSEPGESTRRRIAGASPAARASAAELLRLRSCALRKATACASSPGRSAVMRRFLSSRRPGHQIRTSPPRTAWSHPNSSGRRSIAPPALPAITISRAAASKRPRSCSGGCRLTSTPARARETAASSRPGQPPATAASAWPTPRCMMEPGNCSRWRARHGLRWSARCSSGAFRRGDMGARYGASQLSASQESTPPCPPCDAAKRREALNPYLIKDTLAAVANAKKIQGGTR